MVKAYTNVTENRNMITSQW